MNLIILHVNAAFLTESSPAFLKSQHEKSAGSRCGGERESPDVSYFANPNLDNVIKIEINSLARAKAERFGKLITGLRFPSPHLPRESTYLLYNISGIDEKRETKQKRKKKNRK